MSLAAGILTRREVCAALGAAAAALGTGALAGCSNGSGSDDTVHQGFASDTQYKDEALTLYIVADENLKRTLPSSEDGVGRLESYFSRYQGQAGREQVTFGVKYKNAAELKQMASDGFPEGTGVVALQGTVEAACEAGVLNGGAANTSVRSFTAQLYEELVVVRKADGTAQMPKADTLSGEDSEDGTISCMQNLPKFDGKIAVAAETLTEGMLANRVLARWGYYNDTSGIGGEYSKEIKDKIRVYKSLSELCRALQQDKCQLGFAVQSMLWGAYPQIEQVYKPAFGTIVYNGASIPNMENDTVVRDFFEFVTRCS